MSQSMQYNPGSQRKSIHINADTDFAGSGLTNRPVESYSGPVQVDSSALLERASDPGNKNAIPVQQLEARHQLQEKTRNREELLAVKNFAQLVGTEMATVDYNTTERSDSNKPRAMQLNKENLFGHLRERPPAPGQYEAPVQQDPVEQATQDTNVPTMPPLPPAMPPLPVSNVAEASSSDTGNIVALEKKIARLQNLVDFDMENSIDFVSESTDSSNISNFQTLVTLLKIALQNNDKLITISTNED